MRPEIYQEGKEIFESAGALAPAARSVFLDNVCRGNEELRNYVKRLFDEKDSKSLETPEVANVVDALNEYANDNSKNRPIYDPGATISHYTIESVIGSGGMGEVYLAKDMKLGRKVAIKVLKEATGQDPEKRKRFIQEAKAASSLSDPNIITVYEIGDLEHTNFIVTEYINGKDLNEYLAGKHVSLRGILDISIQIVSALKTAHDAGIVHRDIKPANIKICENGLVKILDFGLAKLSEDFMKDGSDLDAKTFDRINTVSGMIMGTVNYMSPEQARGKNTDARTDIFAFGIVLYEMVTGYKPFSGETFSDTLVAVLDKDPTPVSEQIPNFPSALEQIIIRTLRKEPAERYQAAEELLIDLSEVKRMLEFENEYEGSEMRHITGDNNLKTKTVDNLEGPTLSLKYGTGREAKKTIKTSELSAGRRLSLISAISLVLLTIAVVVPIWWFTSKNVNTNTPLASSFESFEVANWSSAAGELFSTGSFSPDGKMIAFESTKSGKTNIWVKQNNSGGPVQVTKDEFYNRFPVWSPSGEELAYYSKRGGISSIWRISALSGSPKSVTQKVDPESRLCLWAKSGKIYYQGSYNLFAVDEKTGEKTKVTDFEESGMPVRSIVISRDEALIAYLTHENSIWRIKVINLKESAQSEIVNEKNEIRNLEWHPNGREILYTVFMNGHVQIFKVNLNGGEPQQLTFSAFDTNLLDVSPDGNQILYGSAEEHSDLWRIGIDGLHESVVAADITSELWADVSADGNTVVFQSIGNLIQGNKLFDGSIASKSLFGDDRPAELASNGFFPKWSPDGKELTFLRLLDQKVEIWKIGREGESAQRLSANGAQNIEYTVSPYHRMQTNYLSWSPKNDALAFAAKRNGISNVWRISADGSKEEAITGNKKQNIRYCCPIWSEDAAKIAISSKSRNSEGRVTYQIWLVELESQETRKILDSETEVRLLGFTPTESGLIFALRKSTANVAMTAPVHVHEVLFSSGEQRLVNTLDDAYFYNIHLSPDKKTIGFTSRASKYDDVWIARAAGGRSRRLTSNNDPKLYFSSLTWSPDAKSIVFGKQWRFSLLSILVKKNGEEK